MQLHVFEDVIVLAQQQSTTILQRIIGVRTSPPRNKTMLVREHANYMSPISIFAS
jgi:hypothetical protein